ncbi:MAG: deoxyguanosinetriphosphate triphosphohydrolase, partial [Desulfuromonadales bacterium]
SADDVPRHLRTTLGVKNSQRLNTMVTDLIETTLASGCEAVQLSAAVAEKVTELRDWLHANVYLAHAVEDEFRKASRVLRELCEYFVTNPDSLSLHGGDNINGEVAEVAVADFLAGMTDRYAMSLYQKLFFPQPWKAI